MSIATWVLLGGLILIAMMLIGTLVDELERSGKRRGLVTMCASGGMAPAMIIERV